MTTSFVRSKAWVMNGLVATGWAFGATINPTLFRLRYPTAQAPQGRLSR